jgi:hypothetical protein
MMTFCRLCSGSFRSDDPALHVSDVGDVARVSMVCLQLEQALFLDASNKIGYTKIIGFPTANDKAWMILGSPV